MSNEPPLIAYPAPPRRRRGRFIWCRLIVGAILGMAVGAGFHLVAAATNGFEDSMSLNNLGYNWCWEGMAATMAVPTVIGALAGLIWGVVRADAAPHVKPRRRRRPRHVLAWALSGTLLLGATGFLLHLFADATAGFTTAPDWSRAIVGIGRNAVSYWILTSCTGVAGLLLGLILGGWRSAGPEPMSTDPLLR